MTPIRKRYVVAAALLGIATRAAAMPLQSHVRTPSIIASAAHQSNDPVKLSPYDAAANLISKPAPVYPPEAKEKGIQGAVVLKAIIGKDGTIKNLAVISGPEELQASALDAVKKWRYRPYLTSSTAIPSRSRRRSPSTTYSATDTFSAARSALFAEVSRRSSSGLFPDGCMNGYSGCSRESESDDGCDEEFIGATSFPLQSPPVQIMKSK